LEEITGKEGSREPSNCGTHQDIPFWNDEPGRTFAEVEAVMEKAALRAAEAGE
jgi:hypothetical protein